MDFSNKVVIITGASSGIGASVAVLYAKQSAKLVLTGRNEQSLNTISKQCEEVNGIKPLIVKADVTDDNDIKKIVLNTIEHFGRIDVLVNNAGVGVRASILDGVKPFDEAIATNIRSAYLLTSLATPYLIESKGNVVNVSSVAAFGPIKGVDFLPYCISKAAMDQFTKCVALELGPQGVRVNSVNPGCTRTPFAEAAGFTKDNVTQLYTQRAESYPLRKVAERDEVADLILYLSSDRARSITGSVYVIDNGEMLV
ncbi:Short-chain dehydrogenase [Operophtera brumata]|uniref:Short-chain dehydrogenase n=1 Tax=Operophtera brumata TaxID=104452 RepID=A0A0L7KPN2_OPEBR|nr:Short-chain dehydrogenase [Operophtera brumata]